MLLTVTHGTASGDSAQVEVDPEATPMDVLHAIQESGAFGGIDPSKERFVVSSPRLGRDLLADEQLGAAGIRNEDLLTVDRSETGYSAMSCRSRSLSSRGRGLQGTA